MIEVREEEEEEDNEVEEEEEEEEEDEEEEEEKDNEGMRRRMKMKRRKKKRIESMKRSNMFPKMKKRRFIYHFMFYKPNHVTRIRPYLSRGNHLKVTRQGKTRKFLAKKILLLSSSC